MVQCKEANLRFAEYKLRKKLIIHNKHTNHDKRYDIELTQEAHLKSTKEVRGGTSSVVPAHLYVPTKCVMLASSLENCPTDTYFSLTSYTSLIPDPIQSKAYSLTQLQSREAFLGLSRRLSKWQLRGGFKLPSTICLSGLLSLH